MMGFNPVVTAAPGDCVDSFTLSAFGCARTITYRPGRPTVLSFCALWCVTWEEQARRIRQVSRALAGLPIDFLTISVDGRWAERFDSASNPARGVQQEVLLDVGSALSGRLGVRAVPYTFVLDRRGIIRYAHQGIVRMEDFVRALRPLATGQALPAADRNVYLTFDDFPTIRPGLPQAPSDDELLLDILRALSVQAAFFCIGEHLNAPAGAAVGRRALREGHALEIHSWSHDRDDPQIARCVRAIIDLAPDLPPPTLYRPPGRSDLFRLNGAVLQPRRPVVDPYDFTRPGAGEIARRVLQPLCPGAVIQLHAGVEETRDALPDIVAAIRRQELRCAALG